MYPKHADSLDEWLDAISLAQCKAAFEGLSIEELQALSGAELKERVPLLGLRRRLTLAMQALESPKRAGDSQSASRWASEPTSSGAASRSSCELSRDITVRAATSTPGSGILTDGSVMASSAASSVAASSAGGLSSLDLGRGLWTSGPIDSGSLPPPAGGAAAAAPSERDGGGGIEAREEPQRPVYDAM